MRFTRVTEHFSLRLYALGWNLICPEIWASLNAESVFWTLYQNDREGGHIEAGEMSIPLKAGENYLIPPNCRYSYGCDLEISHFFVYFDILGLSRAATQELFPAPFQLAASSLGGISLADVAAHPEAIVSLTTHWQCLAALTSGIMYALEALPPERQEQSRLRMESAASMTAAFQYIEANLAKPLSNQEIATCCHMSKDYFIRLFREKIGQTPTQYILEARVKRAVQLLLFSNLSLEEIASEAGFGNRYYFTRVFSRHMGLGPAAYRKRRFL